MNINIEFGFQKITITEPLINDTYHIEKENDRFFVTSDNGLNMFDGTNGHKTLDQALTHVKQMIRDHFFGRCEDEPKNWRRNIGN